MSIIHLSAAELSSKLAAGEVSSVEATAAHLDRIAAVDGDVHAFLHVNSEALATAAAVDARRAAGEPLGELAGVPIAIKDVLCTIGMPSTAGSKILEGWIPPYDATVVSRLRAADLIPLGKTNMDEFAMGSSTEHSAYGPTRNPWDLERIPSEDSGVDSDIRLRRNVERGYRSSVFGYSVRDRPRVTVSPADAFAHCGRSRRPPFWKQEYSPGEGTTVDKTQRDPREYIESLPEPVRRDIHLLDASIAGALPDEERVMWEGVFWGGTDQHIIGYGELVQPRPGTKTVEWFVVGLTAQKDGISLYVNAVEHGEYLAEKLGSSLGAVSTGKSVIRFRSASDVDMEALLSLVRRAVALTA